MQRGEGTLSRKIRKGLIEEVTLSGALKGAQDLSSGRWEEDVPGRANVCSSPDIVQGKPVSAGCSRDYVRRKGRWRWGRGGDDHSDHMRKLLKSDRGADDSVEETW